ncbi:MAG: tRNA epoxyqueuosine(34) reductase QueG [Alphaproteobacteria bacterium]|nr:tRNA epoxyqueuosine(34) reductase QueG [Alphaproteobacteria bacterium]MBU1517073.1 tRNA epoxyqueuosine(34) reductase QueG [Alphaproteobacteria bacterium]MBU2093692.1 tRNA epoxyqueuosine(34) reductase QueG [Alphaproteobacteria bacterium]MBU2153986.1 tRNA epoxyqueuosine(34) reductase QueG [Alphaproteobacteria bacterium]MBU2308708.1 tRNA epoxyqueuosine(34) reductase QueG [Alphaproteobacteria bacterium]
MTISTSDTAEALIRAEALALGFDLCRFTDIDEAWPAAGRLFEFVDAGRHGEMGWMAETAERRKHPRAMWDGARSAVMLGVNYGPDRDPLEILAQPAKGAISVYAQGDDYHEVIKARLKTLARWMVGKLGGELKVFVDTAPLLEKPLAERAGLGWQGKHTNLVSREFGSWLFLGSILTTLELEPDAQDAGGCGTCQACLDICPTKAFPAPYQLDARRCISYLTIELKGPIPREFRSLLGNRIYGCDDCLAVCPWNKFAQSGREQKLAAREALTAPSLSDLARLDDPAFRTLFSKSPVKRIGRDHFVRNVLYAIGNSGDPDLAPEGTRLLGDTSPVVRGAAVWALSRLLDADAFETSRMTFCRGETDPDVLGEWSTREGP